MNDGTPAPEPMVSVKDEDGNEHSIPLSVAKRMHQLLGEAIYLADPDAGKPRARVPSGKRLKPPRGVWAS